jgi:hypothetical protein
MLNVVSECWAEVWELELDRNFINSQLGEVRVPVQVERSAF